MVVVLYGVVEPQLLWLHFAFDPQLLCRRQLRAPVGSGVPLLVGPERERGHLDPAPVLASLQLQGQQLHGALLRGHDGLHQLPLPEVHALLEARLVALQQVQENAQLTLQQPYQDVRVEGAAALGLDRAEGCREGAEHRGHAHEVGRHAVGNPVLGGLADLSASPPDGLWAQAEHVDEEQPHHQLEHQGLAPGVRGDALRHVAERDVLRLGEVVVEGVLLPLHGEEQGLLGVCQIRGDEQGGRAEAQGIRLALSAQLLPVPVGAD